MKKALKIVTLILAVCMTVTFMFGCSLFGSISPKKAEEKLEDAGYNVQVYDDEDSLVEFIEQLGVDVEGTLEVVLFAYNIKADILTACLFKDESDAEEIESSAVIEVERVGKWIIFGSEDAIEAFKG